MNRLFLMGSLLVVLMMPQALAEAKSSAYPNPYRQTAWNKLTDSINTLGEDPQQKKLALQKLHNSRTRTRLRDISQANQAKNKAKRRAWMSGQ